MNRSRICFVAALLVVALGAAASAADQREFGFGKLDVTPREPVRLTGYGSRSTPSEGVEQRLWTRTMAVRTGDGALHALVSVDSIGFPGTLTTAIAQRLEEKHGITRERFVLCATHSHTTPHIAGGLTNIFSTPLTPEEEAAAERYTTWLADRAVECVGEAIEDLAPGRMFRAVGKVGFAVNRRILEGGQWTGFGINQEGPVDHSVPVLRIVGPDEKLRGIVFNYACHCTTLGPDFNRVCGDWAGYAQDDLEDRNPGAVALCTIGAGADANPLPRGELQMAQAHGRALALEVQRLLSGPMEEIGGELVASFGYAGLPIDRPSVEDLRKQLEHEQPTYRRHAQNMLEIHERMRRLPETYPMPLQTWQFGDDLTMVFLGGEVVVDYAHRLKREIETDGLVWVTAYANDVFGYVASERVRREGGYEVDRSMILYNQPGPWSAGTEDLIIERVQQILKDPAAERARSPEEALKTFQLPEGYAIELVAAEPLIADPVNFAFGPDGKLWVVEMGDYPRGRDGSGAAGGTIKFLEDTDGDGRFDKGTVFLDGLPLPSGVMPWRDGVLVCSAPDILYAEDTDGDGRADRREVLFTGFESDNTQSRINGFEYGLDNWLYLAIGHSTGEARSAKRGEAVGISGRDVRIRPDDGRLEAVSGRTQYGRNRDDWGNWFGGTNSQPIFHFVISDRYLRRNSHVPTPSPRTDLLTPPVAPPVYPSSRTVDRFNDVFAANRFTSACSPMIFRDRSLGPEVAGAAFICEPVHNLVHRSMVVDQGVTFRGERHSTERQSEFLSSTDTWFRPAWVETGPDGALWVADMYRHVIEDPRWIPEAWQKRLNLRAGEDRGRVYRVYRQDAPPGPLPNLADRASAELVETLTSPNGWQRDTAQRLLIERSDERVVPALEQMAFQGELAEARAHALWTLDGLGALRPAVLARVFGDRDSRVVRQAILASESQLAGNSELGERLLAFVDHSEIRTRYQLALTLGEWEDPRAGTALGQLAIRDAGDAWMRTAILSSAAPHAAHILETVLADLATVRQQPEFVRHLIATAIGEEGERAVPRILAVLTPRPDSRIEAWQMAALASVLESLQRHKLSLAKLPGLAAHEQQAIEQTVRAVTSAARERAADADASLDDRQIAVRLLGSAPDQNAQDAERLSSLLAPQVPAVLQKEAVAALVRTRDDRVPAILLAGWRSHSPGLQAVILEALSGRPEWTVKLLDAVAAGDVLPLDIDAATRVRLLEHKTAEIRERAAAVLASTVSGDRQQVLAEYGTTAELEGNPIRGAELFTRHCATCHRLRGRGNEIGPNLAALQDKSAENLLVAVLDPNRAVEQKYRNYVAALRDGRILTGMIAEETTNSLTLALPNGTHEEILRGDLDELVRSAGSFMPEGLEKNVTPADLADVIAFVQSAPLPAGALDAQNVAQARRQLREAGLNGLAAVQAAPTRKAHQTWLGDVEVHYCSAGDRTSLTWTTAAALDELAAGQPHLFRVPVAMGAAPGSAAEFQLQMNGRELLQLTLPSSDASWTTADGRAGVRYLAMQLDATGSSGLLEIEVPADLLTPGEPSRFAVVPPTQDGSEWFSVILLRDRAVDVARQILDESLDRKQREKLIHDHPNLSVALLEQMTADLGPDAAEEYRRIPWIWRVAIAAGRRNDAHEVRRILDLSLPAPDQPLRDWQAVVIGGGIINGISQTGAWPRERIREIIGDDSGLSARWRRALDLAAAMADDDAVKPGTRYDALRMIALQTWGRRGGQLGNYLARGTDAELQMGAISGLADMNEPEAADALLSGIGRYSDRNRGLALDALLRTEQRRMKLLEAVQAGRVSRSDVGEERIRALKQSENEAVRARAKELLSK